MQDMTERKRIIENNEIKIFDKYDGDYVGPFIIKGEKNKNIDYSNILKCNACHLSHKFRGLYVGNMNAKYMFVGEAPSTNRAGLDIEANYVWHDGPSSKILKDALHSLDILKDSFFTNVIKCSLDKNQSQRPEEYEYCMNRFLLNEISLVHPEYIILMGKKAYESFVLIKNKIPLRFKYRKMLHPSYFIYKGKKVDDLIGNIREVLK